jgi:hypothetical protein
MGGRRERVRGWAEREVKGGGGAGCEAYEAKKRGKLRCLLLKKIIFIFIM